MTSSTSHAASHRKGLMITALGGLVLTADIPLIRLANGDAWSVLAARSALTFLAAIIAWMAIRMITGRRAPLLPGRAGIMVLLIYGLSSVTFILAVFNTTTANLVFILAFNPMFAAILSWIFLGERPGLQTFLAMGAMLGGILLIVAEGIAAGHVFGDLAAFASSFLLAAAITISRKAGTDMGFAPLLSALLPAMAGLIMIGGVQGLVIASPGWILINGLFVIPIAFWCLATGPKYISGPEVAMFYLVETVLAPIWIWMIFTEQPSARSLAGGAIIVAALVAHSLWHLHHGRRKARTTVPRHPL